MNEDTELSPVEVLLMLALAGGELTLEELCFELATAPNGTTSKRDTTGGIRSS